MTRTRLIFTLLAFSFLIAHTFAGEKKFGKELTIKERTKISQILANPEQYKGKRVLVEGMIVDVCKERGCWIKIASDKEFETITFKVEDGVMVFPLDVKGQTAVAEGVISVRTYSIEDLVIQGKERAKEEGTTFDPTTVKAPKIVVRLMGEGAVVQ